MYDLIQTDVLVVGGGPAGIGAALGAARRGARTLIVENHAFFGGIASFTMGMCMNQMRPAGEPRSAVHELLIDKLSHYGSIAYQFRDEALLTHALFCNVEYLKVAILDALESVGCQYLVHCRAVDTLLEGNRVTGIVVATKRGLARIHARAVVDCTGDADVATYAGAETMQDAVGSPMTLCFDVTNVDREPARAFTRDREQMIALSRAARDRYPLIPDWWALTTFPSSTAFYVNHSGTRVFGSMDATDPFILTQAEAKSRRQVLQMVHAMRDYGPESLQSAEIIAAGPQIGVRETRRIKGEYILTEEDSLSGRAFDDGVAWRSGVLDIGFVRTEPMPIHDVPYRALLPEKIDGLLVGGRCISTDHAAASAGKSMGNCLATGHAAGLAAALTVDRGILPRELQVTVLRDALRADGVDLDRAGGAGSYSGESPEHWRRDEDWSKPKAKC